MEDYPGQNYYWKHSPTIKRAEAKFYAAINGTEKNENMQAELIHPLDMAAKINASVLKNFYVSDRQPVDDLIEIDGKLYYQTVRVPATTKDIS